MDLNVYINRLPAICRDHGVDRLYAFGSVLTDRFNSQSDVDLLVSFDKGAVNDAFLNFFDLKYSLEELFDRPVDLIEDRSVRNPVLRRSIDRNKRLLYGRPNRRTDRKMA